MQGRISTLVCLINSRGSWHLWMRPRQFSDCATLMVYITSLSKYLSQAISFLNDKYKTEEVFLSSWNFLFRNCMSSHYKKSTAFHGELFLAVYVSRRKLYPIFDGPFTTAENLKENR
jgi:hypothetical protein